MSLFELNLLNFVLIKDRDTTPNIKTHRGLHL